LEGRRRRLREGGKSGGLPKNQAIFIQKCAIMAHLFVNLARYLLIPGPDDEQFNLNRNDYCHEDLPEKGFDCGGFCRCGGNTSIHVEVTGA
jgi:hypothetical protein